MCGFGIALGFIADVILNAPEAFIKALSLITNKEYGTIKVVCDICLVILSATLSVVLFNGKRLGIGEDTVISAISVGSFVSVFCRILRKSLSWILKTTGRM